MLDKFKLSTRIMLVCIVLIVCYSAFLAWMLPTIKKHMYDAKYLKTKHVVEAVWGVVDYYAKQAGSQAMTAEDAKKSAQDVIKTLRYDKDEYFWINDLEPRMIVHSINAEMNGKSLADHKDPQGKALFVAMVDVCKSKGEGFVDYMWSKPGFSAPVGKISYVKLHPAWGWIIGSGIYLDDVEKEVATLLWIFLIGAFICGVVGLGLSILMARSITRPINQVAEGLTEGADQVAAASSQVAAASQSLAEGNSNQASSLEETSSSLEELSSMTRQTADNASQAKAMMTEVRQIIAKVNHHMGDMATAIRDITKSSQETGKIIKTIDEIAFQTNLLALNAAVEAARAGEAGAGFAVVANEVRNLAMRAAEAAKNTSSLIENTIQSVHKGNTLTASTLEAFKENMTISDKVGLLIEEIATASQEQSHGIGQINTAVANMDKVTQDAAANAEESASASEEMNAQAEQMKVFVRDLVNVLNGQNNLRRAAGAGSLKKIGMTKTKPSTRADLVNAKKGALALPMDRMGKARIVRPEDIIPLEEDKFKDF